MKYLLSGYFGFGNGGDDAILVALVDGLRALDPDARISVLVPGPEGLPRNVLAKRVPRDRISRVVRAMREADVFISGGGSLLQDATSRRSLVYYAGLLLLARALGRPRVVLNQGVGPLDKRGSRWLVAQALKGARISVRDEDSARLLTACGVDGSRIMVTADPVWTWYGRGAEPGSARRSQFRPSPEREPGYQPAGGPAAASGAQRPARQLAVVWRFGPGAVRALALLWEFLRPWAIQRGYDPVVVPLQRWADQRTLKRAGIPPGRILAPAVTQVAEEDDPRRWVEIMAGFDLVLSTRYHGVVFSALAGVPALALAYDPKLAAVCRQLGLPEPLPLPKNEDEVKAILQQLDLLDARRAAWLEELPARLASLSEAAWKGLRLVVEAAGGGGAGHEKVHHEKVREDRSPFRPGARDDQNPSRPAVQLMGITIHRVTFDEAVRQVAEWTRESRPKETRLVVTANPELVLQVDARADLEEVLRGASLVVPDGIGLIWASRRLRCPLPERVPGIDLAYAVMGREASRGLKVFLLGARPGVATKAAQNLQTRWTGLEVVGVRDGYFSSDQEDEVVASIAGSGAQLLLVGMGAPRQELWVWKNRHRLGVPVAIGVGGALDVWAGEAKRAPLWLQRLGLEWAYRFARQPSRAGRMLQLPRFVWRVWRASRA